MAEVLSKMVGDALVKAGTGVQGELNLRLMLIDTFSKVKPMIQKLEKASTLEECQLIVREQMVNSFKVVNALHSYFA